MIYFKDLVSELTGNRKTNVKRLAVVKKAMQKAIVSDLTPRQREILTLKYAANKKGVEIAELLGINLSRVTRVLQRAEKTLQKSLRFYMEFLNSDLDDE